MATRRRALTEDDHLEWWKDKLVRMNERTFAMPGYGHSILTQLYTCEGNSVEAKSLKELAARLAVPLKFLPRAVASATRLGILTTSLTPPRFSILLHRDRLRKRKIGLHRRRAQLARSEREQIKAQSNYRCACCGEACQSSELVLDHVIPLSLLGADHPANLVPMKKSHNSKKWDRLVRGDIARYRNEVVSRPFGVRFVDGAFWPVINGRLRRARPAV